MKKRKAPSKLSKAHINAICKSIELGCPYEVAARTAGIDRTTLYKWRNGGSKTPLHLELKRRMAEAEAEFIRANLETIQAASKHTWMAAAWMLERRFPQHFAKINERAEMALLKKEVEVMRANGAIRAIEAGQKNKQKAIGYKGKNP